MVAMKLSTRDSVFEFTRKSDNTYDLKKVKDLTGKGTGSPVGTIIAVSSFQPPIKSGLQVSMITNQQKPFKIGPLTEEPTGSL